MRLYSSEQGEFLYVHTPSSYPPALFFIAFQKTYTAPSNRAFGILLIDLSRYNVYYAGWNTDRLDDKKLRWNYAAASGSKYAASSTVSGGDEQLISAMRTLHEHKQHVSESKDDDEEQQEEISRQVATAKLALLKVALGAVRLRARDRIEVDHQFLETEAQLYVDIWPSSSSSSSSSSTTIAPADIILQGLSKLKLVGLELDAILSRSEAIDIINRHLFAPLLASATAFSQLESGTREGSAVHVSDE